ncbi:hypothetical protein GQ53DRAFT_430793 [Thozetella sp. PMI_491]|nr:hypothetical protein GQ53DRAFT_430793 [Thozetella sp. PMI_491]
MCPAAAALFCWWLVPANIGSTPAPDFTHAHPIRRAPDPAQQRILLPVNSNEPFTRCMASPTNPIAILHRTGLS